jgi:hypothetical protein
MLHNYDKLAQEYSSPDCLLFAYLKEKGNDIAVDT